MIRFILVLVLFLSACKGDFVVTDRHETEAVPVRVRCTYHCYQFGCMPGFNGQLECRQRSAACDGTRAALVKTIIERGYYSKAPGEYLDRTSESFEYLSDCTD